MEQLLWEFRNLDTLVVFLKRFGRQELTKYSKTRQGFSASGEVAYTLLLLLLTIDSLSEEIIAR